MRRVLVPAIFLAIAGVSCSNEPVPPPQASFSPPPFTPQPGPPTAGPTTTPGDDCGAVTGDPSIVVTAADFSFTPSCVQADPAQGVQLVNGGTATHTFTVTGTPVNVTAPPGTTIDGPALGLAPGTYVFVCRFHEAQGMVGELRVV